VLPAAWQIVELNPAHVAAQRRAGDQRGVKTDRLDLVAISDLLIAGHRGGAGRADPAMVELVGLVAHRGRRVQLRTATKTSCSARSTGLSLARLAACRACWTPRSDGCW
jgi:transposase